MWIIAVLHKIHAIIVKVNCNRNNLLLQDYLRLLVQGRVWPIRWCALVALNSDPQSLSIFVVLSQTNAVSPPLFFWTYCICPIFIFRNSCYRFIERTLFSPRAHMGPCTPCHHCAGALNFSSTCLISLDVSNLQGYCFPCSGPEMTS